VSGLRLKSVSCNNALAAPKSDAAIMLENGTATLLSAHVRLKRGRLMF
jgi:hypothetical protein